MLAVHTRESLGAGWRRAGESGSRSQSVQGRRSGEIMGIREEDEDEDEGMEVEEVDDFGGVGLGEGEYVEEEKAVEDGPVTPPR